MISFTFRAACASVARSGSESAHGVRASSTAAANGVIIRVSRDMADSSEWRRKPVERNPHAVPVSRPRKLWHSPEAGSTIEKAYGNRVSLCGAAQPLRLPTPRDLAVGVRAGRRPLAGRVHAPHGQRLAALRGD